MRIGNDDFQCLVISLLLKDQIFCIKTVRYLKEEYFGREDTQDVFALIKDYAEKYNTPPTKSILVDFAEREGADTRLIKEIGRIHGLELQAEYVRDKVVEFARSQEWRNFSVDINDLVKRSAFDELQSRAADIAHIGTSKDKDVYDFFEYVDSRVKREDAFQAIGTGIRGIDDCLDSGGLGDGELGLIIAPPSGGKSTGLINIGKNGIMHGYNVFHFTEEMSDRKTAKRYDQCLLGMTKQEVLRTPRRVINRITEIAEETKRKLYIKEHPSNTCSIAMLHKEVEVMIDQYGVHPDMVIVDYADLLLPSRHYTERRFELEDIYRGLRGLGQRINTRVWSGSQTQASTIKGTKNIGMEHLAESIVGKAAIVDLVISINQSIDQKKMKRGELFIAKNRDDERDISVPVCIDWSRTQISDLRRNFDDD